MVVNFYRYKSLVKMASENEQSSHFSFSKTEIKMNTVLHKNRASIASLSAKSSMSNIVELFLCVEKRHSNPYIRLLICCVMY